MIKRTDKVSCKAAQQLITNISHATAARYIVQVRKHLNKEEHQIITVGEFCDYWGLKIHIN